MYKKLSILLLAVTLIISCAINTPVLAATTFTNPFIYADVPDPDVVRVGNAYYMTSTTMHMNPGVPIMKSYDLVNWEIVNYVYDTLANNDEQNLVNGKNSYGHGSWASSLRYNNGKFYVVFAAYDTGKTYIYQTKDIEKGPWTRSELPGVYHDMSLLFDTDGRVYMTHGSGDIKVIELNSDVTAIKAGGVNKVIIPNSGKITGATNALAEGSHIYKINGKYYIFLITWPSGQGRQELCYRADSITGPYEGKVVLNDSGIAQGGIIDTASGAWYSMLFQDHGAVGRIPYLVPVTWANGWPVFGVNGKVPLTMNTPATSNGTTKIVASDEFNGVANKLPLAWQWNHNPDNTKWSLTTRAGFLRLTTGKVSTSILDARNTLTQRTFGPTCSGNIAMEISNMKDGDFAGLAAFQKNYGFVGVKMSGTTKSILMVNASSGSPVEVATVPVNQSRVYFKLNCDFTNRTDKATFYYSFDGTKWTAIGNTLQMSYTLPHFMGYRFAIFNYATKASGGFVDIDYFRMPGIGESSNTSTGESSTVMGNTVTLKDGWYYIKNVNAQKYLQVSKNIGQPGQNVELRTGSGSDGQKWYLTNVGNGCVTLKSALGNYMVDVSGGEDKDGANIQIYNAYSNDAQKFSIKESSVAGAYAVATMASKQTKVLDDSNFETTDGANVCQWTYGGKNNQLWTFEPTSYFLSASNKINGDVNNDGKVNLLDYAMLKNYLLGNTTTINFKNADVNADGNINSLDFATLKKLLLS